MIFTMHCLFVYLFTTIGLLQLRVMCLDTALQCHAGEQALQRSHVNDGVLLGFDQKFSTGFPIFRPLFNVSSTFWIRSYIVSQQFILFHVFYCFFSRQMTS